MRKRWRLFQRENRLPSSSKKYAEADSQKISKKSRELPGFSFPKDCKRLVEALQSKAQRASGGVSAGLG
ncbi:MULTISPECIES: hypothetical protein [Paraburkholderia]|uniref:hypothetical protein n=1 Tax=Paraburkholderia TaxID=1822464 RepID=UPI000F520B8C|nr:MULTISPECIES: hypothetical protein [Paraburkholderia]MBB2978118.1 hypothetical protein [Paraburkholderia tropica]MBB2998176.1 hypothetical protein [Paraburkholderia tropica]MBB6317199.1 hypothetical protein [Paraburkholderia tropica]RQM48889.1 hypothetical protein EHZ19_08135 [Paraburkholderia bannensis]RQN36097.1 hypothetical protein EHZ25_25725 [Paraburkholderia tropica]